MARSAETIIRDQLGQLLLHMAALEAANEALMEENKTLKDQLQIHKPTEP
jgi:cell shape-determining protein MreC